MSEALDFGHYPFDPTCLPAGWVVTSVGQVAADIKTGFASGMHNSDGDGVPHLRPMNVGPTGDVDLSDLRYVADQDGVRLAPGDVLFNNTNSPAWVGKTALVTQEAPLAFSNHMTRLRMAEGVVPRFAALQLQYLCTSGYFRHRCKKHVNQASIASTTLAETVPFVLPPTAEQRRIVAKLDELLASSHAARAALEAVPAMLEQYRRAVLAAAFRGDLTAEWRAEHDTSLDVDRPDGIGEHNGFPALPRHWRYIPVEHVAEPGTVVTYGIVLPGPEIPGGVPYVRQQDIEHGCVRIGALGRTSAAIAAKHSRSALRAGDVLLCIIRHLRVAVVPPGIDGANVTQGTVRIRPASFITAEYLASYLAAPGAQEWMKQSYIGMAMPRINVKDARAVPVAVPPLTEQHEIVRRLTSTLGTVERQMTAIHELRQGIDQLERAALAKAFRGELVPQDSTDEPASALLARARARSDDTPGRRRSRHVFTTTVRT